MRCFLITENESYLKQYYDSRTAEKQAAAELDKDLVDDPAARAEVAASHARMEEWRRGVGDPLIARSRTDREGAQAWLRANSERVRVTVILQPLRELRARMVDVMGVVRADRKVVLRTAQWSLIIGGLIMIGVAVAMAMLLTRALGRPIVRLTGVMDALVRPKRIA